MGTSGNQVKTNPPENFIADDAIGAYRIAIFGSEDGYAAIAAGATVPMLGITGELGATEAGKRVDVYTSGTQRVYYGGTVAAGNMLTSDANGAAITTTTGGDHVVGRARIAGVAGDIGTAEINPDIY